MISYLRQLLDSLDDQFQDRVGLRHEPREDRADRRGHAAGALDNSGIRSGEYEEIGGSDVSQRRGGWL